MYKTLMKEIEKDVKIWDVCVYGLEKSTLLKCTSKSDLQIWFKPYKILQMLYTELEKKALIKITWNHKGPQETKYMLNRNKKIGGTIIPDFKTTANLNWFFKILAWSDIKKYSQNNFK